MVTPTNMAPVESVFSQIRQYQAEAASGATVAGLALHEASQNTFTDSVKGALQEVNATPQVSKTNRNAYERGEDIPLTDVVMGIQKSSLAFEATLQIRNKVLKAYEEIMNMPV